MGFFSYLFWGGLAGYGIHKIRQANEEEERRIEIQHREEAKRKSCVYKFNQGLSEDEFRTIVYSCTKKIKRIENVEIDGLTISCLATSQSCITQWRFLLDYNDYGKLTGKCYSKSENDDSNIPERLNDLIYEKLESYIENFQPIEDSEEEEKTVSPKKKKRKKKKRSKKMIFVFSMLLIIGLVSFLGYYEYQKLIPIGYSNSELEGLKYTEVIKKLEKKGFTNVLLKEIDDLSLSQEAETDIVTQVNVGNSNTFSSEKKHPYDLRITIEYHTLRMYKPSYTSQEAKGMNYIEVVGKFKEDGYTNIKTVPEYDVVMGWFVKDGEVKSIKINGEDKYDEYEDFRPDSEIVITYHSLRSNNPR